MEEQREEENPRVVMGQTRVTSKETTCRQPRGRRTKDQGTNAKYNPGADLSGLLIRGFCAFGWRELDVAMKRGQRTQNQTQITISRHLKALIFRIHSESGTLLGTNNEREKPQTKVQRGMPRYASRLLKNSGEY